MMANEEPDSQRNTPNRVPAFDNEDDLRSEFLPETERRPRRVYRPHAGSITPGKILRLILGLVTLAMTWYLFLGPGRPFLGKFLDDLKTIRPMLIPPSPTPTEITLSLAPTPTSSPTLISFPKASSTIMKPSPTPSPVKSTPTETQVSTVTPGATGCVPAASVTLADVGKVMCVTGNVVRTEMKTNAFLITLDNSKKVFYFVSYDRTWDGLKTGTCVFATGEIKQLGDVPVMALSYTIPLEFCP